MLHSEPRSIAVSETIELLRRVPALERLEERLLGRVAAAVELVSLPAGRWLFRAGDQAAAAYVIASGRLEVVIESPQERVIRVLRRGSVIGELALLRGGERTASVRARRDSSLIALGREEFEALLERAPGFAVALNRVLAEQLASSTSPAAQTALPKTLAVLALDEQAPAGEAAGALAAELERYGSTACLTAPPSEVPDEWPSQIARAEQSHHHVVLCSRQPDPAAAWTSFCLREGERIVAITTDRPQRGWYTQIEALFDCELIAADAHPSDELIARVKPRTVRSEAGTAGIKRAMSLVARGAAGRSVGVVLSGGGARAFAHVGVLEQLVRAGIPIDRIGGVSLGAVVAGMFARGDSSQDMYGHCRRYFVEQNPTNDYTLPVVSLIRGRKTERLLSEGFGDARIESLSTPFFCTSSDLLRRELFVHKSGPLAQALLASLSIPGVFPPAIGPGGRLLVDGGVFDNLPLRTMASYGVRSLIAVDVTGTSATDGGAAGAIASPAWQAALRRWIVGSDAPLPRLPETIIRCMTLASADTVASARQHADLVITPDVTGIGLLDWRQLPQMREAGIAAAGRALAENPDFVTGVSQ